MQNHFKMARERLKGESMHELKMKLISEREKDGRNIRMCLK